MVINNFMKNVFLIFVVAFALSACTTSAPVDKPQALEKNPVSEEVQQQNQESDVKTEANAKTELNNNAKTELNNNEKQMENKIEVQNEDLAKTYEGVLMKTNMGDIEIKLYSEESPVTVNNFLNLAKKDFYDGVKFHRVIKNFMVQAGDPLSKDDSMINRWGTGGPGYAIEDEYIVGLSNTRGTISMANSGPNTGGSQFFINVVNNSGLDWDKEPKTSKHPVFGEVVVGMDIVDKIATVETVSGNKPAEPIIIEDIVLLEELSI